MKHIKLGDLDVSRIGLGLVSMSYAYTGADTDDAESIRAIRRALELGVTFPDTAEVYGPYINEELLGKALKGRRDQAVVATSSSRPSRTTRSWSPCGSARRLPPRCSTTCPTCGCSSPPA